MKTRSVYLVVLISTFFWGANFALAGPILHDIPPLWAAALRFSLAALIMVMYALWRKEDLLSALRRHAAIYLLIGAVGICGFNLLFFAAMRTASAGDAALIMATNPLLTTLLAAVALGERPSAKLLISLPLALFGVIVVISGGDLKHLMHLQIVQGDILMLGANVAWAFYNVISRSAMPKLSALTNTAWVMTAGAVMLLGTALFSTQILVAPGINAGIALLLMATGGTVLAYLFWNTGIAHLGAGGTALFMNLIPVFALLVVAIMGKLPSGVQLVGGALVIAGVSITMLSPKKQNSTPLAS
ncbi:MAG: DMT family transporter [Burkholderiales bacterium]